jgi:flagellar hook-basal body complex protein FliE
MNIGSIGTDLARALTPSATSAPATPDSPAFGASLADSLGQVDQGLRDADHAITVLATGQADHLHQAMIALEQASLGLELTLQIRNKLVAAYDEISRMQL